MAGLVMEKLAGLLELVESLCRLLVAALTSIWTCGHMPEFRPATNRAPSMSRRLTREDCDLILKGAVVLACGGGGPLHFAREIIEEIDDDEYACIEPPDRVADHDWMAMVALVGTPSKVHRNSADSPPKVRQRRMSPWQTSPLASSPWSSPRTSPRSSPIPGGLLASKSFTRSLDNLDNDRPQSPRPTFYELVKHVMRVKFLCTSAPRFEDGDAKTPCNAARNTFLYLQRMCQLRSHDYNHYPRFNDFTKLSYVLTGELGAVNMATALYLSAVNQVQVVDGDGAGRSVPLVNQITYADNFSCSPTVIMSSQPGPDFDSIPSTVLDFPHGHEKMVEEVAAALISDEHGPFSPYIGYGSYVITGEVMGDIPVFGSYTTALAVGKALHSFEGDERALAVSQVLHNHGRPNSIIFQGTVTEKVLQDSNVKDTGHLVVTAVDGDKLKLYYKNEIILAGRPGEEPVYMAPDSLCLLPAAGLPVDISSIPDPRTGTDISLYVLLIQADEKIRSQKVIRSFESIYRVFKHATGSSVYSGPYREWLPEHDDYRDHNGCHGHGLSALRVHNNNKEPPSLACQQPIGIVKVQAATPISEKNEPFFSQHIES